MDVKHIKCFGPCMVKEWELEDWEKDILARWNEINLYTLTRGINRFKGLALTLSEVNERYIKIAGLDGFIRWTEDTKELSNESLSKEIQKTDNVCMKKALVWSKAVNKSIDALSDNEKCVFDGVRDAILEAKKNADIAIVSSANEKAVLDEWKSHCLLDHVDIVLTQNVGSKTYCLEKLIHKGYKKENILMIGDAPGDLEAAQVNGVLFYPILVKKEAQSWKQFKEQGIKMFNENKYIGNYQLNLIDDFKKNLS